RVVELVRAALDPAAGHLAEVATHGAVGVGRLLRVVLRAAEGELAVVVGRPRRPRVAVEGHPDAAGVEQVGAVGAGPAELLVAVAEDDRAVANASEHASLVVLRLGRKALDVRKRR